MDELITISLSYTYCYISFDFFSNILEQVFVALLWQLGQVVLHLISHHVRVLRVHVSSRRRPHLRQ